MSINDFDSAPVFAISVVAQLTGMHPQTLRQYDRLGLVSPQRTTGGGRRYSANDIERLRAIQQMSSEGIGLTGVRRILDLEQLVDDLRQRVADLESDLDTAHTALTQLRQAPTHPGGEVVLRDRAAVVVWRRPLRPLH